MQALKKLFSSQPAGAREPMRVATKHYILKTDVKKFPAHCESCVFATGCFWGTEKVRAQSIIDRSRATTDRLVETNRLTTTATRASADADVLESTWCSQHVHGIHSRWRGTPDVRGGVHGTVGTRRVRARGVRPERDFIRRFARHALDVSRSHAGRSTRKRLRDAIQKRHLLLDRVAVEDGASVGGDVRTGASRRG